MTPITLREQVLADLALYAPFVSVGSYLIVEDAIVDLFRPNDGIGLWRPGPLSAIEQLLAGNTDFRVDKRRERHLLTTTREDFSSECDEAW